MNTSTQIPLATAARVETGWNLDPLVVVSLVLLAGAYGAGVWRLRRRGHWNDSAGTLRVVAFAAGLAAIVAALISPLDALSHDLLSAHMGQHLLLVLVAAPLLVVGRPSVPVALALPLRWRRGLHRLGAARNVRASRRVFLQPLVVWTLQVIALWTWHLPALYEAAVRSHLLHAIEHASFLGTALLFWWVLIGALPAGRRAIAPGLDVLYVVTAGVQGSVLGALLTFASSPLYGTYVATAPGHGVSALQDQQVAGLLMWIPAGLVYLTAASLLFVRWLRSVERDAQREERLELAATAK